MICCNCCCCSRTGCNMVESGCLGWNSCDMERNSLNMMMNNLNMRNGCFGEIDHGIVYRFICSLLSTSLILKLPESLC